MLRGFFNLISVKDGEDASYKRIDCNLSALSLTADNVQKEAAVFRLVDVNGASTSPFTACLQLHILAGSVVLHTISYTRRSELEYRLPTDNYGNATAVRLEAYSDESGTVKIAEILIPVVRENPIPFPRSEEWSSGLKFKNGEYLLVDNVVYMWSNPVAGNSTLSPDVDVTQNPQTTSWKAYQQWPLLSTMMLLADFDKIGQAIFRGDYTLSQRGKDASGQETDDYRLFDPSKVGQADSPFTPNILIDWVSGLIQLLKMKAVNAEVSGILTANSGSSIGGMKVGTYRLLFDALTDIYVAFGNSVLPGSTAVDCNLYIKNTLLDTFKQLLIVASKNPTDSPAAALQDVRSLNYILAVPEGNLYFAPGSLMDIPGVVLAGRVNGDGGIVYQYGLKRMNNGTQAFTVDAPAASGWIQYNIRHNLGHANYTVNVTPISGGTNFRKYHPHIIDIQVNSFIVAFIDSGTSNSSLRSDFYFSVIGENTVNSMVSKI